MKPHQLKVVSHTARKRIGRGLAAGQGKTAGRGTKGQNSRSGVQLSPVFEGGQNALIHRIPKKRGFRSRRVHTQIIHTDQLNKFKSGVISREQLLQAGMIRDSYAPIKLLYRGELKAKSLKIEIDGASQAAFEQLKATGGSILAAADEAATTTVKAKKPS